jgi:hypothetical protein
MTTFYKIRHATDDNLQCYVGSTDNFAKRKIAHKHDCNNPNGKNYNIKLYQYIRANGGFANWRFEVLLEVEGLAKIEKLRRERELTELHGATLNVHKAGAFVEAGDMKEYRRQHVEEFKEYDRQRYDTDNLCDRCGTTYRSKTNKNRHQRSQKCQQLVQAQQPQIIVNGGVVNINIHNH